VAARPAHSAAMLALRGAVVQMPRMGEVVILEDAAVVVDAAGDIAAVSPDGAELDALADAHGVPRSAAARRALGPRQMLLPGLIDTHVHAPQLPFTGTGTDLCGRPASHPRSGGRERGALACSAAHVPAAPRRACTPKPAPGARARCPSQPAPAVAGRPPSRAGRFSREPKGGGGVGSEALARAATCGRRSF
jgi:hypothetical protein